MVLRVASTSLCPAKKMYRLAYVSRRFVQRKIVVVTYQENLVMAQSLRPERQSRLLIRRGNRAEVALARFVNGIVTFVVEILCGPPALFPPQGRQCMGPCGHGWVRLI